MHSVMIDTHGRLLGFQAVPPQVSRRERAGDRRRRGRRCSKPRGCRMAAFTPVAPQWAPRDFADTRAAWEGPLPERPDIRVRIEAAAYRGRPVSFLLIGPWTRADADGGAARGRRRIASERGRLARCSSRCRSPPSCSRATTSARAGPKARRDAACDLRHWSGYAVMLVMTAHHLAAVDLRDRICSRRAFGGGLVSAGMLWIDLPRAGTVRAPLLAGRHSRLDSAAVGLRARSRASGDDLLGGCVIGVSGRPVRHRPAT